MTAKPINPSFAEFSGDAPILWRSRTQVRQKLLRKWLKESVSCELTQPEINVIAIFTAIGPQAYRWVVGTGW